MQQQSQDGRHHLPEGRLHRAPHQRGVQRHGGEHAAVQAGGEGTEALPCE